MKKKELLFFEWVVVDNCNLNCDYCVNKGEYSHKQKDKVKYTPGIEIDISQKVVELSKLSDSVIVNLTGGEPLLAENIVDVISILSSAANVKIKLITNFILAEKIAGCVSNLSSILISLHVKQRSDSELLHLIKSINRFKNKVRISLSQVDYKLTMHDRYKLAEISQKTGIGISFQVFIPPWTEDGKITNGQRVKNRSFVPSLGKRCSLGHIYFSLKPDGFFRYGLWCNEKTRKTGNFLLPLPEIRSAFFPDNLAKCPALACGCNYNTFCYGAYRSICKKYGYGEKEIFGPKNTRFTGSLKLKAAGLINKCLKFIPRTKEIL